MYDCVIATMNSNEIDVNEWVVHNLLLGFSHIYIYDDHSYPNIKETLHVLPQNFKDRVTVYRLDHHYEINQGDYTASRPMHLQYYDHDIYIKHKRNKQRYLMNYFLKTHKHVATYCFFGDMDEYIYLKKGNITTYLMSMNKYDIIYIPWIYYGTSFYIDRPKGLLTDNFRFHNNKYDSGKSIVNMKHISEIKCIHTIDKNHPKYYCYDRSAPLYTHEIHINHYITKAYKSSIRKKKEHCLGQTNEFNRSIESIVMFHSGLNIVRTEHIMKPYVDRINRVLNYELNNHHTTEQDQYIYNTPKCYLHGQEITKKFIHEHMDTILDDILYSEQVYYN
jgi:hypothetical protein